MVKTTRKQIGSVVKTTRKHIGAVVKTTRKQTNAEWTSERSRNGPFKRRIKENSRFWLRF